MITGVSRGHPANNVLFYWNNVTVIGQLNLTISGKSGLSVDYYMITSTGKSKLTVNNMPNLTS
jgi:hypothetical protein